MVQRIVRHITAFVFLAIIGLMVAVAYVIPASCSEKTAGWFTDFPKINFSGMPDSGVSSVLEKLKSIRSQLNYHFEDNFVFRIESFDLKKIIEGNILGLDPLAHKTVKGTDGWRFLGDDYSEVIATSVGILQFDDAVLKQTVAKLKSQQIWLADKGIHYIVAIPHNKHTIYGQYLPIAKSLRPTKLDQLKYAMDTAGIEYVDLSSEFIHYPDSVVYQKTDTHWNDFGAYLGCEVLINKIAPLFPGVRMKGMHEYQFSRDTCISNDLVKMLNIEEMEIVPIMTPKIKSSVEEFTVNSDQEDEVVKRYCSSTNGIKMLMFRDSFCRKMIPFLKEAFGESVYVWKPNFDKAIIHEEQPDVVVHEIVERHIDWYLEP